MGNSRNCSNSFSIQQAQPSNHLSEIFKALQDHPISLVQVKNPPSIDLVDLCLHPGLSKFLWLLKKILHQIVRMAWYIGNFPFLLKAGLVFSQVEEVISLGHLLTEGQPRNLAYLSLISWMYKILFPYMICTRGTIPQSTTINSQGAWIRCPCKICHLVDFWIF